LRREKTREPDREREIEKNAIEMGAEKRWKRQKWEKIEVFLFTGILRLSERWTS